MLDADVLASQVLRALRGRRSQPEFSRFLGYRSNVAYKWEAARTWPTAARFFEIAARRGVDVDEALRQFYGRPPPFATTKGSVLVSTFLRDITKSVTYEELSERTGCSRYAIGRAVSGQTQVKLPDFFRIIDAATLRLLDFVACFVDPDAVPVIASDYARTRAARQAAYDLPMTQAVLRALEVDDYRTQAGHEDGLIAKRLGISIDEERRYLEVLATAGQIQRRDDGAWAVVAEGLLDTRADPERAQRLRAHWATVAVERMPTDGNGMYGYNLFSLRRSDLPRVQALQREYFAQLQRLVADSEPPETVVLVNALITVLVP